jgi:pyridoxal phosphate enzyme (YggS family)
MAATADLPLRWHLVGHLQSNKARKAAQFSTVHSIDAADLLLKLDRAAADAGRSIDVLIQVDLADEPTKFGATPDTLEGILQAARRCTAAQVKGLMLLPPAAADQEDARPYFRQLRELRDRLAASVGDRTMLSELSMGMSDDFEVAIEEGATLVRIGTAIFGAR